MSYGTAISEVPEGLVNYAVFTFQNLDGFEVVTVVDMEVTVS
jgi:hypothetical protein